MEISDEAPPWHALSSVETVKRLNVDPGAGLNSEEAARRTATYGSNAIQEQRRRGSWRMLLDQVTDFMIVVLIAAAIVSGIVGEAEDAVAIIVIVVLNGVIGFVQEYRAERAVAALRQLAAPTAAVRRNGRVLTLPAAQLVPGDIVLLEAGAIVPADMRVLEAAQLKVDEAALTGESVPAEKATAPLREADLPLGDRVNMAYKGTVATYGRGTGVVVATGMSTELGKIATLLSQNDERRTPLQQRLAQFGRRLALAALAVYAIVFGVGLLRGEPLVLMFLTAVSLAVAAIPEALPAVVTVSLALSQMGHVLAIRSESQSLFHQGLWSNRPLLGAVLLTTALQLMTIYVPSANPIFKTEALSAGELALSLALSSVVFVAVEIEKWMVRGGWLYQPRRVS
jgi:Ca2+-transporting ATPase